MPSTSANQCDGCRRRLPYIGKIHYDGDYPYMVCTRERYEQHEMTTTEMRVAHRVWAPGDTYNVVPEIQVDWPPGTRVRVTIERL